MTISELIEKLEEVKSTRGDLDVFIDTSDGEYGPGEPNRFSFKKNRLLIENQG